jgi:micrococcal nuclease
MQGFPKAKIVGLNPIRITNLKLNNMYEYRAKVIEVYDGDTITVELDLGFKIKKEEKIRLAGINTPEVKGEERELGLISRDRLRELILGKDVVITTFKDKKGKYGRYLGDITYTDEDGNVYFVNDWLVEEGLAEYKEY